MTSQKAAKIDFRFQGDNTAFDRRQNRRAGIHAVPHRHSRERDAIEADRAGAAAIIANIHARDDLSVQSIARLIAPRRTPSFRKTSNR